LRAAEQRGAACGLGPVEPGRCVRGCH
jgi:hypothetical protein